MVRIETTRPCSKDDSVFTPAEGFKKMQEIDIGPFKKSGVALTKLQGSKFLVDGLFVTAGAADFCAYGIR